MIGMDDQGDKRGAPKGSFGNVAHERSEEVARQIETMAGLGISQEDMAIILNISVDTIGRHYRAEADAGLARAKVTLLNRAHRMAMMEGLPPGLSPDRAYEVASRKIDFLLNVVHRVRPGTEHDFGAGTINVTISPDDGEL
jgi:hypothetical protein